MSRTVSGETDKCRLLFGAASNTATSLRGPGAVDLPPSPDPFATVPIALGGTLSLHKSLGVPTATPTTRIRLAKPGVYRIGVNSAVLNNSSAIVSTQVVFSPARASVGPPLVVLALPTLVTTRVDQMFLDVQGAASATFVASVPGHFELRACHRSTTTTAQAAAAFGTFLFVEYVRRGTAAELTMPRGSVIASSMTSQVAMDPMSLQAAKTALAPPPTQPQPAAHRATRIR